jgi:hypothetical protein
MAMYDALIYPDRVEIGGYVNTGGIYYGPYNKVICIGKSDNRIALHIKGHNQFWSQTRHYIRAHIIVLEVEKLDEHGAWCCRNIWEMDCGRQTKKVKAEALALLE